MMKPGIEKLSLFIFSFVSSSVNIGYIERLSKQITFEDSMNSTKRQMQQQQIAHALSYWPSQLLPKARFPDSKGSSESGMFLCPMSPSGFSTPSKHPVQQLQQPGARSPPSSIPASQMPRTLCGS
jgi:hypothetical protein